MASVEPRFVSLNGTDPVAYILSANVRRRHISAGQRAMATVMAREFLPQKSQGKGAAADAAHISKSRLSFAITVHEFAPDLVPFVLAGTVSLDEAYEEARERWGFSRVQAHRLIDASEVVSALPIGNNLPTNEAQARELARIPDPQQRAEAWQRVTESHGERVTAQHIREAVRSEEAPPYDPPLLSAVATHAGWRLAARPLSPPLHRRGDPVPHARDRRGDRGTCDRLDHEPFDVVVHRSSLHCRECPAVYVRSDDTDGPASGLGGRWASF